MDRDLGYRFCHDLGKATAISKTILSKLAIGHRAFYLLGYFAFASLFAHPDPLLAETR